MASNPIPNNQIRIRDNATVKPINIPAEKLKEYNDYLAKTKGGSSTLRTLQMKKLFGRGCCICAEIPDFEVIYQLEGCTRLERYCEGCINKVYAREGVL